MKYFSPGKIKSATILTKTNNIKKKLYLKTKYYDEGTSLEIKG